MVNQDLDYVYAQATTRYLFGKLRVGVFFQTFFNLIRGEIYGLETHLKIRNIPLNIKFFLDQGSMNVLLKLIFSL